MIVTYGSQPDSPPPGYFKAIHFPVLALLDQRTTDGRLLKSQGAGTRDVPLSVKFTTITGYGHQGADVAGALFEVTVDAESGKMSGKGYLLNDPNGRRYARMVGTQAMRGNSVDLADYTVDVRWNFQTDDIEIDFNKFNLAATTGVCQPAFAEAYAELPDGLTEEELVAAFGPADEPLIVELTADMMSVHVDDPAGLQAEIVASGAPVVDAGVFFVPEANEPTKIIVDADGNVFGHLALWNSCHDGFADRCVRPPRPIDGYSSFNKPGVLTDRGIIATGPIFAYGGHRPSNGADDLTEAYGSIENAWADVRVTEGRFGPWLSGRIRPGVSEETVYAARASRISGHWVRGALKAIVSVNAEGYDVAGPKPPSAFAAQIIDSELVEMVASFPTCMAAAAPEPDADETPTINVEIEVNIGTEDADESCPDCGADMPAGANYCPNCGTEMSAPTPAVPSAATMLLALVAE